MVDQQPRKKSVRLLIQGLGALLIVGSLVLVFAPQLVSDPGPAKGTFEAVERRVRWGILTGLGAFLVMFRALKPWAIGFLTFAFWIVTGYLVARLIGIALDGFDSPKQWMWVGVEAVLIVVFVILQRRKYPDHALFRAP